MGIIFIDENDRSIMTWKWPIYSYLTPSDSSDDHSDENNLYQIYNISN